MTDSKQQDTMANFGRFNQIIKGQKMKNRTITFAEALKISSIDDADFYPFAKLNASGRASLQKFIADYAKNPDKHDIDAWTLDAANAATALLGGWDCSVELDSIHANDKCPHVLKFAQNEFDWYIHAD